jgi:hypothetical protein
VVNSIFGAMSQDQIPFVEQIKEAGELPTLSAIAASVDPIFLLLSFAATVPYQLKQIKVVYDNMRKYEVGDPLRFKDPKTIIARRALSAFGGVLGTIGVVLGSGIFYAVGGVLKVATGVMCLYTNGRLYYEGYKEEQKLLKEGYTDQKLLENARYKMLKGKAGFVSSAVYIGYFASAIAVGTCPPVILLGVFAGLISIACALLEQEGSQEKYYILKQNLSEKVDNALKLIESKVDGWKDWVNKNYDKQMKMLILEDTMNVIESELLLR